MIGSVYASKYDSTKYIGEEYSYMIPPYSLSYFNLMTVIA